MNFNRSHLPSESALVGFDIVNRFPSIKNGFQNFRIMFKNFQSVIKALELCLTCNNSTFNYKNYLQTDGTAQGPHMLCCYADVALATFNSCALTYNFSPTTRKMFRDNVFVAWTHGSAALNCICV